MAHETLKTLITNNIKTNRQNAITAQILQDVLIAMVDEYPDVSGFATRTWVQQQDNALKEWVENKHYVTQDWANQKFENYLPLTGGTMTGTIVCGVLASGYYMLNNEGLDFSIGNTANYRKFVKIGFEDSEPKISFAARNGQLIGTEITRVNVTSDAFIKRNGTAAQFLKADGSVDGSTYATTAQMNNYLPLTGGNLNGNLSIYDTMNVYSSSIEWNDNGDYSRIAFNDDGITVTAHGTGYVIANKFIKNGGTAAQFLKADGSVDGNTYLQVVNGIVSVSSGDMDIYSAGGTGGMATIFEAKDSQDVIFTGSPSYFFSGEVHASAFIKDNGTSDQVLCADGSVKTMSELKAALNAV